MTQVTVWRSALRSCAWAGAALGGIVVLGTASIVCSGWLIDGVERTDGGRRRAVERSALGDYFGGASVLFSGLALLLLITSLFFQQRELRVQRQELALQRQELTASRTELRRNAEANLRGLHMQLTQMVMDDPSLEEVWNQFPGASEATLRRHLFANLAYSHLMLYYSWHEESEEAVLPHAQSMLGSTAFRRYWDATRASKSTLPPDSTEGRMFRIFEAALADMDRSAPGSPP